MYAELKERYSSRERILMALLHSAEEKGLSNISLDEISKTAGLSKGGVLHYFPTKAMLVSELVDWCYENAISGEDQQSLRTLSLSILILLTLGPIENESRRVKFLIDSVLDFTIAAIACSLRDLFNGAPVS